MNLVKCEDCGNEISKRAILCPKCGRPKYDLRQWLMGVVVLLGMIFGANL